MIRKLILTVLILTIVWQLLFRERKIVLGPGVLAPNSPIQTVVKFPVKFKFKGATFTPLARFDITAKLLSKEYYSFDRSAELSPVDFALGWGRMSDEAVLEHIQISQSGRWYRWRSAHLPISRHELETHSANMHLIPASDGVESLLEDVKEGQILRLIGTLVAIEKPGKWHWKSSLTRHDSGAHACEVIFVEKVQVLN